MTGTSLVREDPIPVVAAVIEEAGRFLLCQRHRGAHLSLKWEFPGGKIESGESPEEALRREIAEELGAGSRVAEQLAEVVHQYRQKTVHIRFFRAALANAPRPIVHRALEWIHPRDFDRYSTPPPNAQVLERIQAGEFGFHDTL